MKTLIFFLFLIFTSFAKAHSPLPLQQGDVIKGAYIVSTPSFSGEQVLHRVRLPPGEWVVVRTQNYTAKPVGGSTVNAPMRTVSLAQFDKDGRLAMGLFIRTNTSNVSIKWNDEPCMVTDALYKQNFGTSLWNQKCLTIRLQTFLQTNNAEQNISREFYALKNIKYSRNMLDATISRMNEQGKWLSVHVYLFPDQYGFENPVESVLPRHPWHSSMFKGDSRKVDFIKTYADWAEKYAEGLFKLFEDPSAEMGDVKPFFHRDF